MRKQIKNKNPNWLSLYKSNIYNYFTPEYELNGVNLFLRFQWNMNTFLPLTGILSFSLCSFNDHPRQQPSWIDQRWRENGRKDTMRSPSLLTWRRCHEIYTLVCKTRINKFRRHACDYLRMFLENSLYIRRHHAPDVDAAIGWTHCNILPIRAEGGTSIVTAHLKSITAKKKVINFWMRIFMLMQKQHNLNYYRQTK